MSHLADKIVDLGLTDRRGLDDSGVVRRLPTGLGLLDPAFVDEAIQPVCTVV